MNARLLVAHRNIRKIGILFQSLADSRHVPVTKNAKYTGKERMLLPIPLDVLVLQELNQGLGHR